MEKEKRPYLGQWFWSTKMVDPDDDLMLDGESYEKIHDFGAGGQSTQLDQTVFWSKIGAAASI